MTKRLQEAMRQHRHLRGRLVFSQGDGGRPTESALKEAILRAMRRANLRCAGPRMLRHTFCSHLAMRGASPRAIQELAGDRDFATTQRYMHLSPAAVQSAIQLLEQSASSIVSGDIDHLLNADAYVESVSPKRPGRIDTRGPLRWNPGCSQAHRREREHRHCERRRVVS